MTNLPAGWTIEVSGLDDDFPQYIINDNLRIVAMTEEGGPSSLDEKTWGVLTTRNDLTDALQEMYLEIEFDDAQSLFDFVAAQSGALIDVWMSKGYDIHKGQR